MVVDNPFLGPQWQPLATALAGLLVRCLQFEKSMVMQTFGLKYSLDPDRSPYFQAVNSERGLLVEAASNVICNPPLTASEYQQLEFYGWTPPTQSPEEFGDENEVFEYGYEEESPNFSRNFEAPFDFDAIAEAILTAMVGVYGITEDDYFGFAARGDADFVDSFHSMVRLEAHEGNPAAEIFHLPTKKVVNS
jgi:hypothetical protein